MVLEHNDEFKSFEQYRDLEFEEVCKLKQGYVAEMTSAGDKLV